MKVRNISLALGMMAALITADPQSLAQNATPQNLTTRSATPVAASAPTAVPSLVPYSGAVVLEDGKSLAGEADITFQIFKDEAGGEPLWAETQTVAFDSTGHYKVQLGATNPNGLPPDLFSTGEARWLEVQVAGQLVQQRVLLASVPYALKAGDATTLGGLPASAFALAGSTLKSTAAAQANFSPDITSNVTTTGGTAGYLPVFNGASTVVDSILYSTSTGIGVGDVPNSSAVFDVNGKSIWRGLFNVVRAGNATASTGYNSFPMEIQASVYNSVSSAMFLPNFQLQVEPTGNNTANTGATFNFLYTANNGTPAETGLYFNPNGTIHFAPGQTFPGTGAGTITGVTAGTDLTGGGTSGVVTVNLNTAATDDRYAQLAAANAFTGNQTVNGTVAATSFSGSGAGLTGVNSVNSAELGGLAPSSFAELAANNTFSGTQSFANVGVGTTTPRSLLELQAPALRALGPVLTLTNMLGGAGAGSAVDFNTIQPSGTGTYNPMARIVAQDATRYSDNLLFQSNNPAPIAPNSGLVTNMIITSTGLVGIDTTAPGAQLEVDANPTQGTDAIYGFGATNSLGTGTIGVQGFGGSSIAANSAGSGGIFTGGFAEGTGSGGDGVDASAGGSESTTAPAGYAGYFSGDVAVTGTLSAGAKDFEIDDPLDPANKYLDHASVESSEMVNVYSGNVTTDELGIATVNLPDWFESVNTDFRYQLTVIGKFAQAIISQEIANHQFKIGTNASFTKVSWQVTGVRNDAFAKAHPLFVERSKPAAERGFYAHPELYGQPAEKQTQWARHPEAMRRMKETQAQKSGMAKAGTP